MVLFLVCASAECLGNVCVACCLPPPHPASPLLSRIVVVWYLDPGWRRAPSTFHLAHEVNLALCLIVLVYVKLYPSTLDVTLLTLDESLLASR